MTEGLELAAGTLIPQVDRELRLGAFRIMLDQLPSLECETQVAVDRLAALVDTSCNRQLLAKQGSSKIGVIPVAIGLLSRILVGYSLFAAGNV